MLLRICCLSFILFSCISNGQIAPDPQSHYYRLAFQHILSSPEFKNEGYDKLCVAVFDSIVFQNQISFHEVLGKRWHYTGYHKTNRLLDSLTTVDNAAIHEPYYSPSIAALTNVYRNKKNCTALLFSRITNNMLMAEVVWNDDGGKSLRTIMPVFGQSLRYLIFFRPNGEIEQYYTQLINHN